MIPAERAIEILGLKESSQLIRTKKYNRFYKRADKSSKNAMFDICAYKRFESATSSFVEKTKLLTEYIRHEENMPYSKLATLVDTTRNSLIDIRYGIKVALKIRAAIKTKRPDIWENFHKYYSWKEHIDARIVEFYGEV